MLFHFLQLREIMMVTFLKDGGMDTSSDEWQWLVRHELR